MSEARFRQGVLADFRQQGVAACWIEAARGGAEPGTPDVFWARGALELKVIRGWPARGGPVRVEHLTREQVRWGLEWEQGAGRWDLLIKVGREELFLFDAHGAVGVFRGWNRDEWRQKAWWTGGRRADAVAVLLAEKRPIGQLIGGQ